MTFISSFLSVVSDLAARVMFRLLLASSILFLVLPVVVLIVLSFDAREYIGSFPPTEFSLRWYRSFLDNPAYIDGLVTSVQLSLISTLCATVAGTMAGIALSEIRGKGAGAFETLFLAPKFVPTVMIGFSILGFAAMIGLYDAFTRLIAAHIIITIPFVIRSTLASLVGVRKNLLEAAMSLGASPHRAFYDVSIPLARTGIFAGALMAFVLSFDEVAVSLFLSDAFTQTLPVALVAEMRANLNLTVAAVGATLCLITILVVAILDLTVGLDSIVGQGVYRA